MAPRRALSGLTALCSWRASGLTVTPEPVQLSLQRSRSGLRRVEDLLDSRELWQRLSRDSLDDDYRPASDFLSAPLRELVITEMVTRYASRPPEERWQELLTQATASPADPCDAELLSTYGWNAGFGSGVNIMMAEVALATYFGRTVATCHPINQEYGSYIDLWQSPVRYCNRSELCTDKRQYAFDPNGTRTPWGFAAIFWAGCLNSLECELNMTAKTPWLTPAQRHPGVFPEFRAWSKRFRHFIYDSVFRTVPTVKESVDVWLQKWWSPVEKHYVGVHLRGTDKSQEARTVPIPEFVEKVAGVMNSTGLNLVYLASDDWPLSQNFTSQLKAAVPMATVVFKGEYQYPGRRGGHTVNQWERTVLVAELEILRNATVFVGTASSGIGRLVYFLRTPQEGEDTLSISVDDGGDWFSRFC